LPFEPAGVLIEQRGKGRIYLNMMNGEVPEVRGIPFMVLAIKEKPETLRKVAHAICGAVQISRNDPKHSKVLMAREYPHVEPKTNDGACNIVSQIWTKHGKMTEAQARATFAYQQPNGPEEVDLATTFTNGFLPNRFC
jgi:NitT/TauT family transport system substrate-binding protein